MDKAMFVCVCLLVQVMIVVHTQGNSNMYLTEDGGETFHQIYLPFLLENNLLFHPTREDLILAHEVESRVSGQGYSK